MFSVDHNNQLFAAESQLSCPLARFNTKDTHPYYFKTLRCTEHVSSWRKCSEISSSLLQEQPREASLNSLLPWWVGTPRRTVSASLGFITQVVAASGTGRMDCIQPAPSLPHCLMPILQNPLWSLRNTSHIFSLKLKGPFDVLTAHNAWAPTSLCSAPRPTPGKEPQWDGFCRQGSQSEFCWLGIASTTEGFGHEKVLPLSSCFLCWVLYSQTDLWIVLVFIPSPWKPRWSLSFWGLTFTFIHSPPGTL